MTSVRDLRPGEEQAAAAALTDAFQRDALAAWLWPEPATRTALLGGMFHELVTSPPPGALIEVTDDLDGVAIWLRPGSDIVVDAPPECRAEVAELIGQVGQAVPEQPFWYLEFLGSRTLGAGNGSALLRHRFAAIGNEATALWTGAEVNLSFYGKNGYRALSRHDAAGASAWWMWRD